MVRAIFFDKDGILNKLVQRESKKTPAWKMEELEFIDGAKEAVNLVRRYGYECFMVTNQPDTRDKGAAKRMHIDSILEMNRDFFGLTDYSVSWDRTSDTYKPKTGMVDILVKKYKIDLSSSMVIGDSWRDVVLGHLVGVRRTYLVSNGEEYTCPEEWVYVRPEYTVTDTLAACRHIVNGGVPQ